MEMATSGMRDRFVDKPIEYIRESCKLLAELADALIQSVDDSLLLQPASLDLATLKKRPGDHLVSYITFYLIVFKMILCMMKSEKNLLYLLLRSFSSQDGLK